MDRGLNVWTDLHDISACLLKNPELTVMLTVFWFESITTGKMFLLLNITSFAKSGQAIKHCWLSRGLVRQTDTKPSGNIGNGPTSLQPQKQHWRVKAKTEACFTEDCSTCTVATTVLIFYRKKKHQATSLMSLSSKSKGQPNNNE